MLIRDLTAKMAELYARTLNEFLRSLGVTEQNARDVEFVQYTFPDNVRELRRGGQILGTVVHTIERTERDGLRFIVRCTPA